MNVRVKVVGIPFISSDGITYSVVPDKHLFIREKFLNAHGGQVKTRKI